MTKKNLSKNELSNVSGGDDGGSERKVDCPNCKHRVFYYKAHVKSTGGGCDPVTIYYKCPDCGYEWEDTYG